jgi:autotransporter-associated beta strand protein
MKRLFPVVCLFSCLISAHSFAGSATWNLNPISGDWNTAANWTPATVPNGPNDTAVFDVSDTTSITLSTSTRVNGIVFNAGASAFTVATPPDGGLKISGAGVVNNSEIVQNIVVQTAGVLRFAGPATAGNQTIYTLEGASQDSAPGVAIFRNTSTAGSATFFVNSRSQKGEFGAYLQFADSSDAGNATFVVQGDNFPFGLGQGFLEFGGVRGSRSAGSATFIANGGGANGAPGGVVILGGNSYGGNATFTANGGLVSGANGGVVQINGGNAEGATLIATGGAPGGLGGNIWFSAGAIGDSAHVKLFGNGVLDVSAPNQSSVTIGTVEGTGAVFLGPTSLTVGVSNLGATLDGGLHDGGQWGGSGGAFIKAGNGALILTGPSDNTGSTTVTGGSLVANNEVGSATGTGAVNVSGGTLGGRGIITGIVTVGSGSGTGGALAPGEGASNPTILAIQNALTFKSDGSYTYKLNTIKATADQVTANGVTIESGAQFDFKTVANKKLIAGTVFTPITNTAAIPINGTFANLADGSMVTVGVNKLQVSYSGGDGNDLTLTVAP